MRLLLILIFLSFPAFAQEQKDAFRATNYPLPRFVSLGSDEIFVRTGPGIKYPVKWVFNRKGLPVEITLEYDHWRKIKDVEGQEGWLHKTLLSGKRTALISAESQTTMYQKPDINSAPAAYLEPNVVVKIKECGIEWCKIDASGYKGWLQKQNLWGVYADEIIKD